MSIHCQLRSTDTNTVSDSGMTTEEGGGRDLQNPVCSKMWAHIIESRYRVLHTGCRLHDLRLPEWVFTQVEANTRLGKWSDERAGTIEKLRMEYDPIPPGR
ncbi:hypothetical protein LIA77_09725 [Sarocladium implicatum]|nr:hypothetical protein LIA77_09725 [Sarocladium implicatum]